MPIHLDLTLRPPQPDSPFRGQYNLERAETVAEESEGIDVSVCIDPEDPAETLPPWNGPEQWRRLRHLRPQTAAWASLSWGVEVLRTHRETPITDLVYRWLWRDLHKIGFLPNAPRHHD